MQITKPCPRCQAEVTLHFLPPGTMVDPAPAPQPLPFTTVRCPKCGKRVLFWTGWRLVAK